MTCKIYGLVYYSTRNFQDICVAFGSAVKIISFFFV
jgi:hypothetical protein